MLKMIIMMVFLKVKLNQMIVIKIIKLIKKRNKKISNKNNYKICKKYRKKKLFFKIYD